MKKLMNLVSVLTLVLGLLAARTGFAGEAYLDAEKLAQASLLRTTDHYAIQLNVPNGGPGNTTLYMTAIADTRLYITNMMINGTNIPIPLHKPLSGIPVPADGFRYVQLYITAVDKFGNVAAQGQFSTNYLAQGARISIALTPKFPPVAIKLDPGLDSFGMSVELDGANGLGWSYDSVTGLLTIDVQEPITTTIGYTVTDGAGNLLAHDVSLPFFQPYPGAGTSTNSVLSLSYVGGLVNLPLGDRGYNYEDRLKFDSTVTRNDLPTRAKVIGVPDLGNQLKLYMTFYSQVGGVGAIEVRRWSATGPMEIIPCTVTTDMWGNITLVAQKYAEKVVVTVFPMKDNGGEFQVYVGRTY